MNCKECNQPIPYKVMIEGKIRILATRRYCLQCHPWGWLNSGKQSNEGEMCERCRRPVGDVRGRYCASCIAIMHKQKKKRILVEYKGGKCEVCDYTRCISNLVFHHRDPKTKRFSIATAITSCGIDMLKEEADKCVLLCCRCHGEVHEGLISVS